MRITLFSEPPNNKFPFAQLCEELGNVVVAGITSNTEMKGVPLLKKDGAIKDSIIKLNYVFTISEKMVEKKLFSLTSEKKKVIASEFMKRLT